MRHFVADGARWLPDSASTRREADRATDQTRLSVVARHGVLAVSAARGEARTAGNSLPAKIWRGIGNAAKVTMSEVDVILERWGCIRIANA